MPCQNQEVEILNEEKNDFNKKTLLIFKEIFETFSENNKLNRANLAVFTSKATDGVHCNEYDDRIDDVIKKYGEG